ncbi:MAG: hypothetical protein ACFFCZ_09420 [Promethearchaeota archaeon]
MDDLRQKREKGVNILKALKDEISSLGRQMDSLAQTQLNELRQINEKIGKLQTQMNLLMQQFGKQTRIREEIPSRVEQPEPIRRQKTVLRRPRTEVPPRMELQTPPPPPRTEVRTPTDELRQLKTEVRTPTPEVTTPTFEPIGIPGTGQIKVDEGSQRTFRQELSNYLGEGNAATFDLSSPSKIVQAVKAAIREISAAGSGNNVQISEIIAKYATHKRETGQSAEEVVIRRYGTDIRGILESGQAILTGIGHKRVETRKTMEGAKNLVRKFARKEDVINGVPMILELLSELEKAYES